ncbi:alpha/beta fold hydrolase [Rhizobium sp. CG5]|uniref:alpha/beta hydrolase n=1 Tax=Rhizobium sp. CG5 TaxID=2726076 RepID=UPI00203428F1|nr:alpha/beta fold hydrolase [Rhizobium sp. CG5]MCM2475693.1 alpha/beta fold hydrolase [Rhizobium sp. CG5]
MPYTLIAVSVVVAAVALAGLALVTGRMPPSAPAPFNPRVIGDDPDLYLANTEAKAGHVRPGAQKQIVWADPVSRARTPVVLVYIHGFSASAGEVRPLPDLVARDLGANLYFTRLTGHGQSGDALAEASVSDWIADFSEALAIGERLGDRTVVMATSTGGALVTWALAQPLYRDRIAAVVLLSPNYGLQATGSFLLAMPFGRQIARLVIGARRGFEPRNELHAAFWTTEYPVDALIPMAHLVRLAARVPVETIDTPALFLYSPQDTVVRPDLTAMIAVRWGAPAQIIDPGAVEDPNHHVIAGDALSPSTTQPLAARITAWLRDQPAIR